MSQVSFTVSDRGFKILEPIRGTSGERVLIYESSAADGPHIWLRSIRGEDETAAHLTVEAAQELAHQLLWLVRNHYQASGA